MVEFFQFIIVLSFGVWGYFASTYNITIMCDTFDMLIYLFAMKR